MKMKLWDAAKVIRSKNSGPFLLTLDVIFKDEATFDSVMSQNAVTRERIARLYGLPTEKIRDIVWFRPAKAVKITMERRIPSGHPGDADVYGAQQYILLNNLEVEAG